MTESVQGRYTTWEMPGLRLRWCQDCGCAAIDTEAHNRFHDRLEAIARAADRGDMMTRRIG